jgi:isoquinoline 1-oxidoreductase beta subunit
MQAITIKNGSVQQSNFHQFDALRIHQCPEIVIDIVQHNKEIGGAGEAAVAAVAPALANALIDAKRPPVRRLPLTANDLEA